MQQKSIKVACFGAGYVGATSVLAMATQWPENKFYVYDIDKDLISRWNSKQLPLSEPDLATYLDKCLNVNVFFSTKMDETLVDADVIFLSVNTPTDRATGKSLDIRNVLRCVQSIIEFYDSRETLDKPVVLVEKSTVPVQTCDRLEEIINNHPWKNPSFKDQFVVASNPEFLTQANAFLNLSKPDRILIGTRDTSLGNHAEKVLKQLYARWVPPERIVTSGIYSSELGKLASNFMLAQRLSSINSFSAICEAVGADVIEVEKIIGSDARIGSNYLKPSIGFGGSCLKKDVLCLAYIAESLGLTEVAEYFESVVTINNFQRKRFYNNIKAKFDGDLAGKVIAVFGLAFKKGTDDLRESLAVELCQDLSDDGAVLKIYDPTAKKTVVFERCEFIDDPHAALEGAEAMVVMSDFDELKFLNYSKIYTKMKKPAYVFDSRNCLDHDGLASLGFHVFSIGKPPKLPYSCAKTAIPSSPAH